MYREFPIEIDGVVYHSVSELKKVAFDNEEVLCVLGDCYFDGCGGVPKIVDLGSIYYKLAVACNSATAAIILGFYYENGIFYLKNKKLASSLYILAYTMGESQGVQALSQLYFNSDDFVVEGFKNQDIAKALLRYAYEMGNSDADYYCEEYYPEVLEKKFNYTKILLDSEVLKITPESINNLKTKLLQSIENDYRRVYVSQIFTTEEEKYLESLILAIVNNGKVLHAVEKPIDSASTSDFTSTIKSYAGYDTNGDKVRVEIKAINESDVPPWVVAKFKQYEKDDLHYRD